VNKSKYAKKLEDRKKGNGYFVKEVYDAQRKHKTTNTPTKK